MLSSHQLEHRTTVLLESDFARINHEIWSDPFLREFKTHYNRMLENLKDFHSKEEDFALRAKQIQEVIAGNSEKLHRSVELAAFEAADIARLRAELNTAKKVLILQTEKDDLARKKLAMMNRVSEHIELVVDQNRAESLKRLQIQREHNEVKNKLISEKSAEEEKLEGFERKFNELKNLIDLEKRKKEDIDREMKTDGIRYSEIDRQIQSNENRLKNVNEAFSAVDEEIRQIHIAEESDEALCVALSSAVDLRKQRLAAVEKKVEEAAATAASANRRSGELRDRYDRIRMELVRLDAEMAEEASAVRADAADLTRLEAKGRLIGRKREQARADLQRVEGDIAAAEGNLRNLEEALTGLRSRLTAAASDAASQATTASKLDSGLALSRSKISDFATGAAARASALGSVRAETTAIDAAATEAATVARAAMSLAESAEAEAEIQRKATAAEAALITKTKEKILTAEVELATAESEKQRWGKLLAEAAGLYDSAQRSKAGVTRKVAEMRDATAQAGLELKNLRYLQEQLKGDFEIRESRLVEATKVGRSGRDELRHLVLENEKLTENSQKLEQKKLELLNHIGKLSSEKHLVSSKLCHLKADYLATLNVRDSTGSQLFSTNDEVVSATEALASVEKAVAESAHQLSAITQKLASLKLVVSQLLSATANSRARVETAEKYKSRIKDISASIVEEKIQVKALSEALEDPSCPGRWREVGGFPVDRAELTSSLLKLQKEVVRQAQRVIAIEFQLSRSQGVFTGLKEVLAKAPGPAAKNRFLDVQRNLRKQTRKLKAVMAEINLYRVQGSGFETRIGSLKEELGLSKAKLAVVDQMEEEGDENEPPGN